MYRGWWIVLTGYFSQLAASGASGWVFGVLIIPMQDDLGWSRSTIVGVLTLERLITGACGIWLGPLVDKHGARLLMTLSMLLAGACLMALSLIQAPWHSYVLWAIFGLTMPGMTMLGPVAAISNWFIRKRAQAIMMFTFGSATAGLVLAPLMAGVADITSWRFAWVVMGFMLWAIAPMAWFAVRHRPEDVGLRPDGDPVPPAGQKGLMATPVPRVDEPVMSAREAVRSRAFWLLTLGFALTMLPASSIFIHMSAFVQHKGFSAEAGAAAVSVYGFGALLGRFVWGYGVAHFGLHRSLIVWGGLYGISILLYTFPTSMTAIYATTLFLGIAISGSQQLRAQAYPDYFGRRIVGTLLGYAGVVSTLAGAASPLIMALAFDHTGSYTATLVVFALCCIAASAGFVFSRPQRPAGVGATEAAERELTTGTPGGS